MALRRWAFRARAALARHRGGIDALNVFPVPDGDTGTNMLATLTVRCAGRSRAARRRSTPQATQARSRKVTRGAGRVDSRTWLAPR